jgi:hypothetical protein
VAQMRSQNQTHTRNTLSAAGRLGAWRRWCRERSVIALLPLCDRLARDVRRMFAPHIDVRDLQQAGALGLMKAAQAYDPARGEFEPYASFGVGFSSHSRNTDCRSAGMHRATTVSSQFNNERPRSFARCASKRAVKSVKVIPTASQIVAKSRRSSRRSPSSYLLT